MLNLLGFGFTFAIGWLWGEKAYRPEYFATTEPFLLLFLAMYLAIPILFARLRAVELKDYVDGTLVFGVPIAAFGLQTALVREHGIRRRLQRARPGAGLSAAGDGDVPAQRRRHCGCWSSPISRSASHSARWPSRSPSRAG